MARVIHATTMKPTMAKACLVTGSSGSGAIQTRRGTRTQRTCPITTMRAFGFSKRASGGMGSCPVSIAVISPLRLLCFRKPQQRIDHGIGTGYALARDVVGAAMADRGEKDRAANGQGRGHVRRDQLGGDVSLVVQHDNEGRETFSVK